MRATHTRFAQITITSFDGCTSFEIGHQVADSDDEQRARLSFEDLSTDKNKYYYLEICWAALAAQAAVN